MSPSATPATQNDDGCRQVPRLPRKWRPRPRRQTGPKHVTRASPVPWAPHLPPKRRSMSPSATQNDGGCRQAPRLPRKRKWRPRHQTRPKHVTRASLVPWVPRLPRKTTADVTKSHACHTEWRWMSPSATPATQTEAATTAPNGTQAHHQSQPNAVSATPAAQNYGRCHQMPPLPHRMTMDVAKRHACHANGGGDHETQARQMPCLPRKTMVDVTKRHTCHTEWPATQSEGGCHQAPTPATQNEGRCRQVVCG